MPSLDADNSTKTRLLDTAEALYIESGREWMTLRDLTQRAGVNLAAVNYHFHSKDALVCAMMARRLDPVNQSRMALLTQFEAQAGDGLRLEHLVGTLLCGAMRPDFDIMRFPSACAFALRVSTDLSPVSRDFLRQRYAPIETAFFRAFERLMPSLRAGEIDTRVRYTMFALPGIALNASVLTTIQRAMFERNLSREETFVHIMRNALTILRCEAFSRPPSEALLAAMASDALPAPAQIPPAPQTPFLP